VHFPRLPDWLIYAVIVVALVLAALGRRENADAPEAPPPPSAEEGALLAPASAFDPSVVVKAPQGPLQPASGTAFSVADSGVWITARHVVAGCRNIALMETPELAAEAAVAPGGLAPDGGPPSDIAVLITKGGAPALPLSRDMTLRLGERAFHPGFPKGRAGETTSRLIGRKSLVLRRSAPGHLAAGRAEPVLAWAEAGRTDGLRGDLAGLSGAPALNARGLVVGVTLAEAPRRGRIYTTSPEAIRQALARAHLAAAVAASGQPVTVDNYGRVADTLRRDLSVAQVVCRDR
jgi:S1-C subfamily serine protease